MDLSNKHFIIAIDGPSGTGKSTTAKLLAKALKITYLDTGAMYRAVTFAAQQVGLAAEESEALAELLAKLNISFDAENRVLIDGVLRENEIRGVAVSSAVSFYSALPSVRMAMTAIQRSIGAKTSCVLDGRDIGTVVFPQADFKFFLVTDIAVRAKRRYQELVARGETITLEEVIQNLNERDRIDSSRETAPLRKAEDAIEIDTTQLTIEQQVEKIRNIVCAVA